MFILDTNSITHDQNGHPVVKERVTNTPRAHLFTTSVTVEEQLKGRLAYLNRHRNSPRQAAQGNAALLQTMAYSSHWNILLYTEDVDALVRRFLQVPNLKVEDWTSPARPLCKNAGCETAPGEVR